MVNRQIFQEPSEDHEGDNTIAWLGGMGQEIYTFWDIAQSFKIAGDMLVNKVLNDGFEAYKLVYPVLYNYRHCLELYLKHFVYEEVGKKHKLDKLLEAFEKYIRDRHRVDIPDEYREFLLELHDFDKNSTVFRYPGEIKPESTKEIGEFAVDFLSLREKMEAFEIAFHRVIDADPKLQKGNLVY